LIIRIGACVSRRFFDRLLFLALDVAIALLHPREILRFYRRSIAHGNWRLSVAAPRVANAKFVWRKVFDHDPRFTIVSDKLAAKDFVRDMGIAVEMPQTLWTGRPEDIPEAMLGADVVIKTTHGWSTNLFPARDGLSRDEVRDGIRRAMAQRHGRRNNQWAYYDIRPRLFVEDRVDKRADLVDLKIYVYGGLAVRVLPIRTIAGNERVAAVWLRDEKGTWTRSDQPSGVSPKVVDDAPLPPATDAALEIASHIGALFDQLRVDFLVTGGALYLGEITVYSESGILVGGFSMTTDPSRFWDIRRSWFLNTTHEGWKGVYARALARFCAREARRRPGLNAAGPLPVEDFHRSLALARRLQDEVTAR